MGKVGVGGEVVSGAGGGTVSRTSTAGGMAGEVALGTGAAGEGVGVIALGTVA